MVDELARWEEGQTGSFRGSKSRNKVSVGEPAEGSLSMLLRSEQNIVVSRMAVSLASDARLRGPRLGVYGGPDSLAGRDCRPVDPPIGEGPSRLVP